MMFKKKQLNVNIEQLDLQISKLSEELNTLKRDSKYEATMDKLKNLTELRAMLAKSLKETEKSDAIVEMDKQIEELTVMLANMCRNEEYSDKLAKLEELTKVRCQLAESKVKASVKPIVISGTLSIASMVLVLKHEKTEVITSKAYDMVKGMFKGGK